MAVLLEGDITSIAPPGLKVARANWVGRYRNYKHFCALGIAKKGICMSIRSLARASYLGMTLYLLSLGLLYYLQPGLLTAATAVVGSAALTAIVSKQWKVGLAVLICIMLITFVISMGMLALGSFSVLPISALQIIAVSCLDHRSTAECAIDLRLARLRP
jgi:hypothetical protein